MPLAHAIRNATRKEHGANQAKRMEHRAKRKIDNLFPHEFSSVFSAHCLPLTARCHFMTLSALASKLGGIVTPI
jgi:hypothetical protein